MRLLHWWTPKQWFQTSPKMNKLDRKKLKNVLHYIIHQTMQDKVYKTHLWKILYFSDFDFYEKNNRLMLQMRPIPDWIEDLLLGILMSRPFNSR